jgi:lipopolysaccharide heptosyltransferase II
MQPRLGDAVLSIPVFAALRERYPAARISVLANPYVQPLYESVPSVDAVVPWPTGRGGARGTLLPSLSRRLREEAFDLVIDLNTDGSLESAYLARFGGGGYSLGYEGSGRGVFFDHAVAVPEEPLPFVDLVLGLLAPLGVEPDEKIPRLAVEEDRVQTIRTELTRAAPSMETPFIGLHPGAHHPTQRWLLGSFAELADRIVASGTGRVVLFAGPHEWDQVLQIHELMRETPIVSPASLALDDLAAWLSVMDLLVCNNSGPLHLAAAVGTPTISFMGPTNAVQWWPVGDGHVVLRRDELPCIGCNFGVCRIGTHDCLRAISPQEVFEIIAKRFVHGEGRARSCASLSHALHSSPLPEGSPDTVER